MDKIFNWSNCGIIINYNLIDYMYILIRSIQNDVFSELKKGFIRHHIIITFI